MRDQQHYRDVSTPGKCPKCGSVQTKAFFDRLDCIAWVQCLTCHFDSPARYSNTADACAAWNAQVRS